MKSAGQSPNGKNQILSQNHRLSGTETRWGGSDYQGVGPHCFQMAQPGGKRRPAHSDHEHCRGRNRTGSLGVREHDPQTQPAVKQRPTR